MGWWNGILGVLFWLCFLDGVGLKQHEMLGACFVYVAGGVRWRCGVC